MKGTTKTEKGITLIALIITIVVLLILAAVAINSIQNDGILGHAQNAAGTYNQAVKNEQAMLKNYMQYLNGINEESGDENGSGSEGNDNTTEYVTVTFKPRSSSDHIISLTNVNGMIYVEELETYEIKVPVGTKIEKLKRLRGSWTTSHAAMFPMSVEEFNDSVFGMYDVTVENIPCVAVIHEAGMDLYKTESGEIIDMNNYYATEDITILFEDDT